MRYILGLLLLLVTARADLEFAGSEIDSGKPLFLLSDAHAKKMSGWLTVGSSFGSYTITGFNPAASTVEVKNGNQTLRLHLRLGAISAATPEDDSIEVAQRHIRLIERYASAGNLIVADVRSDESSIYVTPREVWKGKDFTEGVTVAFPLTSTLAILRPGSGAEWILGVKGQMGPNPNFCAGGTDGKTIGGENGVSLDEFGMYFSHQKLPESPPTHE